MEKKVEEMSIREYDEHCEKVMAQFLDEHFYKNIGYTWIERVTDRERQVKGLDVILKRGDKVYNIDEKAAIRYTNGLKTFALELSFLNRKGNRVDGWLIDEKKVNDYFVFVWINKIEGELIENVNSFKEVEVALVSKEKIMIYGDYDVDGITSISVLKNFLEDTLTVLQEEIEDAKIEQPLKVKEFACMIKNEYWSSKC